MILNNREIKAYKITESAEDVMKKSANDPKILVTDFDDTLAMTTPKQIKLILESENCEKFSKFLNLRDYSNRFIYNRNTYYTCDWLKRADIEKVPQEIIEETTNFFNNKNFYKDVKPTKFAEVVKEYLNKEYCEKVYVISHCLTDTSIQAKIDWLAEFFKDSAHSDKIEFIPTKDTRKSLPIIERGIKWDIFADDRLECIYDMVLYGQGFGNEILIPECGYNKPDERFTNLVDKFNLQTFYMDIFY